MYRVIKASEELKLVEGDFSYGNIVKIDYNGKIIKRKVNYGSLDGLYVLIDGEKIGRKTLEK